MNDFALPSTVPDTVGGMGPRADGPGAPAPLPATVQAAMLRDRARIEAELQKQGGSTDPFASAVRATCMPIVVTNPRLPDNPVVFANDAFCLMSGYDRSEIIGRNCRFLQGPESDTFATDRIRAAIAAAEPIEIDIRNHRRNGEPFWNRLMLGPVRDEAGQVAWFFACQLDVSLEREQLAQLEGRNAALLTEINNRLRAQAESDVRLHIATEAGRIGVWELDLRTDVVNATARFRRDHGCPPDGPLYRADLLLTCEEADRPALQAALSSREDFTLDHRVRGSGEMWVELRAQVVRGEGGALLRLTGTSLDITARKRAEARTQALLDLDHQFRGLDDPDALAYAAAEVLGRTLGVSRAGYGTIDLAAETITIPRDWNAPGIQTIAGTLRFRDYGSYIDDLRRNETVVIGDAYEDPRTRDTADALCAISAQAFINMPVSEQGGLVALLYLNHAEARAWPPEDLAFVRDVAQRTRMAVERRRAEQGLRALAASLEQQVEARTAALMAAEAALRQSQKMEAVGQLTGGIAHDFNNLLTGISGSLELLRTRVAQGRAGEAERFIAGAQDAAARAGALTHRLLAFSRQQTLEPRATNVNQLVDGMLELIGRTVGPAVRLTTAPEPHLWNTRVDPSQLENALLNLCINARDAMPGGGKLAIETCNVEMDMPTAQARDLPPGAYVTLAVTDTGVGMSPEVVSKAFDPFFTTKPIGKGTGLGLSMIYGFARQSGGHVHIRSGVGEGTTICVYLPRHAGEAAASGQTQRDATAAGAPRGGTVLLVDDEDSIRTLAAEVLEEQGYTLHQAADGPSALARLQDGLLLDLLITDVGLPNGMNGRELARAARLLHPTLKVLFITGYAEASVLPSGDLEPGMQVLTKPFTLDALSNKVRLTIEV